MFGYWIGTEVGALTVAIRLLQQLTSAQSSCITLPLRPVTLLHMVVMLAFRLLAGGEPLGQVRICGLLTSAVQMRHRNQYSRR